MGAVHPWLTLNPSERAGTAGGGHCQTEGLTEGPEN